MLYLIDAPPSYCPRCARIPFVPLEPHTKFYAGYLHECPCGAQFQHLPHEQLNELLCLRSRDDAGQAS